jgi:retron-type reverse transcriptase
VKRHKRLWEKVASPENLLEAAQDALRGKRGKRAGAAFFEVWEKEVVRLAREMEAGSYRPGEYHYFTIHEPKQRVVAAAPFRDRVVHHALVRVLEPLFEPRFIEDSYACRTGRGTHAGMRRALHFAQRFPYALKCDIRRYFPSIDQGLLRDKIACVVGDRRVLELVDRILESHVERVEKTWPPGGGLFDVEERRMGLPIGNLTSQFFANIYLDAFDHFVKQELRVKGYLRYVDDFLLFGDDRATLKRLGVRCREFLAAQRLEIHPDKYRLMPTAQGVDFCGFVVHSDGRVKVRTANARRFRKCYVRLRREVAHGRRDAEDLTTTVRAWIAHASHAQSWGLRRAVLGP